MRGTPENIDIGASGGGDHPAGDGRQGINAVPLRRWPLLTKAAHRVGFASVPAGTVGVGIGLTVSGASAYGFLAIAARVLGPERYAPLAAFWALLFVGGPGFFIPLEQEVGRALAARRARGLGGRPVVQRAAIAGGVACCGMVGILALSSGALTSRVFGGNSVFVIALGVGLFAYACQFLARGVLSGNGRFRLYGLLLASEGLFRVTFCAALALSAPRSEAAFAFSLAAAAVLAIGVAVVGRRGLLLPGPPASWHELTHSLGLLLIATVMLEFLVSSGTVAVQLLAAPDQHATSSRFLSGRVIAFMPLFLFAAISVPLLPRLSELAASGRHLHFRRTLTGLLVLASSLGLTTTVALTVLGPWVASILFGSGFALGHADFALLAASCGLLMLTQVLGGALVALKRFGRVATGLSAGAGTFIVVVALGTQLFLRVELGLLFGAVVAMLMLAAFLLPIMHQEVGRIDSQPPV